MENPCKACGACENHVRCLCCNNCRNCGRPMPSFAPAWPLIYPIYPPSPWWPNTTHPWPVYTPPYTTGSTTFSNIPAGATVGHTFVANSLENSSFSTSPDATGFSGDGQ